MSIVGGVYQTPSPESILSTSASPGFTWGRSGNVVNNTWLLNDDVPSNKAGRRIFLNNAELRHIFVSNENNNTFDVTIYEHDGTTYTSLATISLSAQRSKDAAVTIALTTGKELAARVTSGSAKNIVMGVILFGEF